MRTIGVLVSAVLLLAACATAATTDPSDEGTSTLPVEVPTVRDPDDRTPAVDEETSNESSDENTHQPSPSIENRGPVIALDPGHSGTDTGAAANGIIEQESNLDLALRVKELLQAEGFEVVLTRAADDAAESPAGTEPLFGTLGRESRRDAQARIDIANLAEALVFVSIHSNGLSDPSVRGLEVYYSGSHNLAVENQQLASELLQAVLAELEAIGRPAINRGVRDDSCLYSFRDICRGIFVISPSRVITRDDIIRFGRDPESVGFPVGVDSVATRATTMPSALVELLFLTNPDDAAVLADEDARDALARGVANGIISFVEASTSAS